MKQIYKEVQDWTSRKGKFAIATVVKTWRSAPRLSGSVMLIDESGKFIGSVSGGCIEGAVISESKEVIQTGHPKLLKYGIDNELAWSVGLSCGGAIEIFLEPFWGNQSSESSIWSSFISCLQKDQTCVLVSKISGYVTHDIFIQNEVKKTNLPDPGLTDHIHQVTREQENRVIDVGEDRYFLQIFPSSNRLIIIGAAHITLDLIRLAREFSFKATVIDPRGLFTESLEKWVQPESLIKSWPEEALSKMHLDDCCYAVLLTHDPKIDDEALGVLLKSNVAYIGALGSKRTHQKRLTRLRDLGFSEETLARIHAPVGLDIGAKEPREIALSILAEMIKIKRTENT
jgi:xanthine dehydrogenase accessory factor